MSARSYDPFRPFRDSDGFWYAGVAIDGCNTTTRAVPCAAGGGVELWRSPTLRGKGSAWRRHGPMLISNKTLWPGTTETREMVTIDFIGGLPGGAGWRVLLNNPYFGRGSTEFFIGKQANGGALDVTTQSMLDWGEFTHTTPAPVHAALPTRPLPVGVDALSRSMNLPTGGRLGMVRTLGGSDPNQVAHPGRRVAIGAVTAAAGTNTSAVQGGAWAMSLPRDLSILRVSATEMRGPGSARQGSVVMLGQAFVPELQVLRRNRSTWSSTSGPPEATLTAFGQQLEIVAAFSNRRAGSTPMVVRSSPLASTATPNGPASAKIPPGVEKAATISSC